MRSRCLLLIGFIALATGAGWLTWGGTARRAAAATDDAAAVSAAEIRYLTSQSPHWRAYVLKR